MAQFTPDQVNTSWGFYGTLRDTFPMALPMTVYNHVVDMLGGDPDVARQYLDSTAGRHFVDAITFVERNQNVSAEQLIKSINKNKANKNLATFFKRFSSFRPYESTPAAVVNKLLEDESPISKFVEELIAMVKAQGGTVPYAEVLEPEQTAEVQIHLRGQDKTFSIGFGEPGFMNAYVFDGEKGYDTSNSIDFEGPAQLLARQFDDPDASDEDGPGVNGPEPTFQTGPDTDTPHWSDPDADRGPYHRR